MIQSLDTEHARAMSEAYGRIDCAIRSLESLFDLEINWIDQEIEGLDSDHILMALDMLKESREDFYRLREVL